jgi:hypothetical protein
LKTKYFTSKYGGIIISALYALLIRVAFHGVIDGYEFSFFSLFSIAFIWVAPFIVGLAPMLIASRSQLQSDSYRLFSPVFTVLLFFTFCFITRIEDVICIVILAFPYLCVASLGGWIFSALILRYRERKGIMYSVLIVPFLFGLVEKQFPTPVQTFNVKTVTIINSSPQNIWQHVVRVNRIKPQEYHRGFFNRAGIPQPLYAELNKDTLGATRTGHFEGGLLFKETVNKWEPNRKVSFNIKVVPSSVRPTVFDQHVLRGSHFEFLNAAYEIKPIDARRCELSLTASYKLNTNINTYASFWGNWMLDDFQERLLDVIKERCDNKD